MEKNNEGMSTFSLTMLALGTIIGGSFFLGSSVAIKSAGPGVVISYVLGGILVYFILLALSEMTVKNPEVGSFRTYAKDMFGERMGFIVGWVYWTGMILAMSSEAIAVSILFNEWFEMPLGLIGASVIVLVTFLNLLGAKRLSKLESGLAAIKLLSIVSFIILGILIIIGLMPGKPAVGLGSLRTEALFPGGVSGIAGSMLIVVFAYAGFEIIGLAATETKNPEKTVPSAVLYTVLILSGLYILSVVTLLPLIPTGVLTEEVSPMVLALNRWGVPFAGTAINIVLITAILSTMLAAMFGLGRMIKSISDEGQAPKWLKDKSDIPYKGIIFSGVSMLIGLGLGFLLPSRVYIFLISFGGFSLLFTYAVIVATHIKYRRLQKRKRPITSVIALISIVLIILSMPLIPGQGTGLIAGITILTFYILLYTVVEKYRESNIVSKTNIPKKLKIDYSTEFSKEFNRDRNNKR